MATPLDPEQRFICALLTAPKNQQDAFYDKQIPISIFKLREPELNWIYRYREAKGIYPTAAATTIRFKWRVIPVKDSWSTSLDSCLGQEHYRQIRALIDKTRESIDRGEDMDKVVADFKADAERLQTFEIDSEDIDFGKSKGARLRYERVKAMRKSKKGLYTSPWATLNKVIKYFRAEELVILMGRLGMGKTYFMILWAEFLAKIGVRVLFVSKEMSTAGIEDRLEAMHYGINPERLKEGTLTPDEELKWSRRRSKVQSLNLIISGKETIQGTGFSEIFSLVRKYKPQVVLIDAAYRIVLEGVSKNISPVEYFTKIASTSKRLARSTKTAVIISIQMNRDAEDKKGNSKGGVTNAYGADAWGQEADLLLALNGKRGEKTREIDIAKSRDSGVGTFTTHFEFDPVLNFSEASGAALAAKQPNSKFNGI